jgi:thioredoxin 1
MANITTDQNFKKDVLESELPVLVDFWAPWCGPCRILTPTIEKLADSLSGKVKVTKINVDENPETAVKYGISGIPTVIVFKNGAVHNKLVGLRDEQTYRDTLI